MAHIILVGGINNDYSGRALGPYRLRTALEKSGHTCDIIDYSSILPEDILLLLISELIKSNTVAIGFSNSWIDIDSHTNIWCNSHFFNRLKNQFPNIKIILGGTKDFINDIIIKYTDWYVTGFADISLPLILDKISNKSVNLIYFKKNHYNYINSDENYVVQDVNQIETVFKLDDGFKSYQPLPFETSRGCIFKCAFCTYPFLGKKNFDYIRTPESMASEFRRNWELFGTFRYTISDDTFNDGIEKLNRVRKAIDIANLEKLEFVSFLRGEMLVTKPEMIPILKDIGLKGAHFGIESFNKSARKSIGKGMDVNRVLDAIHKANAVMDLRSHASFIFGLYDDTYDDFYKWSDFLIANKNDLFASWTFNALGIRKNKLIDSSDIEKNPEKYQYKVSPTNSIWLNWVNNKGVTKQRCEYIKSRLNQIAFEHSRPSGWSLSCAWYNNISIEDINNKSLLELNLSGIGNIKLKERVNEIFQKYFPNITNYDHFI